MARHIATYRSLSSQRAAQRSAAVVETGLNAKRYLEEFDDKKARRMAHCMNDETRECKFSLVYGPQKVN